MRNKIIVISAIASLISAESVNARDRGCDECVALIGGIILGAVLTNSSSNSNTISHPDQPEYTPAPPPRYYNKRNVQEYNAPPSQYYQENTVPPPPLPQHIQEEYFRQYGHLPEYRVLYPQDQPQPYR